MTKAIYFDMDGTIANLYGVNGWLEMLINEDVTPYAKATPLVRLCTLARILNRLQCDGCVTWNEIKIVKYGTPKSSVVSIQNGILFDDEEKNRTEWNGTAYDVNNIIEVLKMVA